LWNMDYPKRRRSQRLTYMYHPAEKSW
jgi:hypothetical protein